MNDVKVRKNQGNKSKGNKKKRWYKEKASKKKVTRRDLESLAKQFNSKYHKI